jgi:hypothetical protein
MRLSLLVRLIIESSVQQMSQAKNPLAEKKLPLEIDSLTQQMSRVVFSPLRSFDPFPCAPLE